MVAHEGAQKALFRPQLLTLLADDFSRKVFLPTTLKTVNVFRFQNVLHPWQICQFVLQTLGFFSHISHNVKCLLNKKCGMQ